MPDAESTPDSVAPDELATSVDVVDEPTVAVPPPPPGDARLLAAHDLALAGLKEITPAATIGPPAGYSVEPDGVVSLRFENRLAGYPGWFWTVSLARVEDEDPTILEVELLPGESALLAPEWVPWAVRLSEYRAQQAITAANAEAEDASAGEQSDDDEDVDVDDLDDLDASDFDTDGSPILHAGDVDGVDIDELDEDSEDEDSEDEDIDSDDVEDDDDDSDDEDDFEEDEDDSDDDSDSDDVDSDEDDDAEDDSDEDDDDRR